MLQLTTTALLTYWLLDHDWALKAGDFLQLSDYAALGSEAKQFAEIVKVCRGQAASDDIEVMWYDSVTESQELHISSKKTQIISASYVSKVLNVQTTRCIK